MALAAAAVWEVRPTGSDSNAGGFRAGASGTDRSQQNSAQATLTTASVVHTTTTQINVAPGDFTVSAADVGNILRVTGGTATAGFYEITVADVANNRWTLDRAVGTAGQTVVGVMGGALASPGQAAGALVTGNTVHVKAGTYSIGSGAQNTAGNRVNLTAIAKWYGYQTTRGDGGTRPVLDAGAASITLFTQGGTGSVVENLEFSNSGALASVVGPVFSGALMSVRKVKVSGMTGTGMEFSGNNSRGEGCEATGCAGSGGVYLTGPAHLTRCVSRSHSGRGIYANASGLVVLSHCQVSACASPGIASSSAAALVAEHCVSRGNTGGSGQGFNLGSRGSLFNCLAVANAHTGFVSAAAGNNTLLAHCAGYNNGGAGNHDANWDSNEAFITLTADPFTNPAGLDFSLNDDAGGGALLKQTGFPQSFPGLNGSSYPDVGAYQSQGGASSSGSGSDTHHAGRRSFG